MDVEKGLEKDSARNSTVRKTGCQSQCCVRLAPHASCNVLKALNPFANTCLVVRQVKEEQMMSQLRKNLWSLG